MNELNDNVKYICRFLFSSLIIIIGTVMYLKGEIEIGGVMLTCGGCAAALSLYLMC